MKQIKEYIGYILAVAAFITLFVNIGVNKGKNETRDAEYKKQMESLDTSIKELKEELKKTNALLFDQQQFNGQVMMWMELNEN